MISCLVFFGGGGQLLRYGPGPFFQAGFQIKYKILFSSYIYQQTLYSTVWGISQLFTLSCEGGVTVTALYWRHLLLALNRSFIYSLFGMSHVRHYKITKVALHKLNTKSGAVRVTPLVCGNTIGYFRNLNYCREVNVRSIVGMLWYDKEMTKLGTVNLRYVDLTGIVYVSVSTFQSLILSASNSGLQRIIFKTVSTHRRGSVNGQMGEDSKCGIFNPSGRGGEVYI